MPLYQKKWWKKVFGKPRPKLKVDVLKDIEAIEEFLKDINDDVAVIKKQLRQLENLETESHIAKPGILHVNLETQARVYDDLLDRYEYFQSDVEINGLRVKQMAEQFLKRCERAHLKDLVKQKKEDEKWKLRW